LASDPTNTVALVFGAALAPPTVGGAVQQGTKVGTIVSYDVNTFTLKIDTSESFDANTNMTIAGVSKQATSVTTTGVMFDINLDGAVQDGAAMAAGTQFYLTPTSRVRRIVAPTTDSGHLNGAGDATDDDLMGAFAVMVPGWGFRNDSQDGVDAPDNSLRSTVREGNFLAGYNDNNMREQIFIDSHTQIPLSNVAHIDATASALSSTRNHPFSVNNVMNNIPEFDIYDR
jgi:hypothetical protein